MKKTPNQPLSMVFNDFKDGYVSYLDDANTPPTALRETLNVQLVQRNKLKPRPGSQPYGATLTTPITGGGEFTKTTAGVEVRYVWVIDNGAFKYSTDGGAWTTVSGKTWVTTAWTIGYQDRTRLYLVNGVDVLAYLDIALLTLNVYTGLSTPSPSAIAKTGLASTTYTTYYRVSAINAVGETAASASGAANSTIQVSKQRDYWISGTDYVTLTWGAVAGATGYNIYQGDASGQEFYLDTVDSTSTSYIDTGERAVNEYIAAPVADSTTGPTLSMITSSQNRLWGIATDGAVWWSGTGINSGAWHPFLGGGYIYLNKGSNQTVRTVVAYRDGKGNPLPTVLTSTPDGMGSTWHINLTTATIGTTTVIVPEAYQADNSVGTNSVRGVIVARNSVFYPSRIGWHVLGSKPNLLNVLATNEISTLIRPDVLNLKQTAMTSACGIYWEGKIHWSVPYGSSTNNEVWTLDLERNSWILRWNIGVKHFFTYTDSSGVTHLLAVPMSGTKLIEFTDTVNTYDSGVAFTTRIRSGLIHFDETHLTWAKPRKSFVEISRPKGTMTFKIFGTKKNKAFTSIGSRTITDTISSAGFGTFMFGAGMFGDVTYVPDTFSESSIKKRLKIGKKINNFTWELSSTEGNVDYTLMQVMIKEGYPIKTSDPTNWK